MFKVILSSSLLLCANAAIADGSPWLPTPSTATIQLSDVNQQAKKFFRGKEDGELPAELTQNTVWLDANYGVSDYLSIDAKVGYANTSFTPMAEELTESGRTDSTIGANLRFRDEFISDGPSLGIRVAATLAGEYTKDKVYSIGDGASGMAASFLIGKVLTPRIATSGEFGYRYRNNDVSDEYFANVGAYLQITNKFSASVGYNIVEANGDLDIGTDAFAATGRKFSLVTESSQNANFGLSYQVSSFNLGAYYSKVLSGRNTSKTGSIGASVSVSF